MRPLVRRLLLVLLALAAAAVAWLALDGGRYLQHEDPLRKADAIFVLAGSRLERPLEAADLYREGWAPTIIMSPGRTEPAEARLRASGITLPSEEEVVRAALVQMGVPAPAIRIEGAPVDNTADEAVLLTELAARHGWHTIIVVTSKYHTRRTGFAMRRALAGSGVDIIVRASRYDASDPAHWWRRRGDFRFASSEWQKLIAYRLGLAN
jgi:uncharacterized SAM-binding protein YcdF (DUF218 family)